MAGRPTFDAPQQNPDDDLLNVRDYARRLAGFIRGLTAPFTPFVGLDYSLGR